MDQNKLTFLQNVLRYSASHSDSTADGSNAGGTRREISPERKQWLEKALDSMSVNPIEEMKKCIKVLQDSEESESRKLDALETLKDWCEDMNFAIDFLKMNVFPTIENLLVFPNAEIRSMTCELIGTCAQNNTFCQETLLSNNMLSKMLEKLDNDVNDVKIKSMFAISCLTRDFELGQKKLLNDNGFDIIIKSMQSPIEKLQTKCFFLCSSLCLNKDIKNELTKKSIIDVLIDLYRRSESSINEHLLSLISILIDDNPVAVKQAQTMKGVNFKQILTDRIEVIKGNPQYNEEFETANRLLQSLFQN